MGVMLSLLMATYFIFSVIGLMTHRRMMNEHHFFMLGASMCMIIRRHGLIIGIHV